MSNPITGKMIVAAALKDRGIPYLWSGKQPAGWDCSGFVRYVLVDDLGYDRLFPHGSYNQYDYCKSYGTLIDIDTARRVPGALLFRKNMLGRIKHVGFSNGFNDTIEARGRAYATGVWHWRKGGFNCAALVPGVKYY